MTPTINVNLASCSRGRCGLDPKGVFRHDPSTCSGEPILLPCPIRRSVTFSVALGECACDAYAEGGTCPTDCPARPVRVSCSISGKTWEESEVAEAEWLGRYADDATNPVLAACRDRWALVKALALGEDAGAWMLSEAWAERWDVVASLFAQRDAVFAALADMARHEEGLEAAAVRAAKAMGADGDLSGTTRASPEFLAAYVEHLVEQVGAL